MSNLKKILSEYEGEFNPNGWAQLEKRLPKPTFMQRFGKFIVGGAAGALVVAGVLVAMLWNNDEKPSTDEPIVANVEIANATQENNVAEDAIIVSLGIIFLSYILFSHICEYITKQFLPLAFPLVKALFAFVNISSNVLA